MIDRIYDALRQADFRLAAARADSALAVYHRFQPKMLAEVHALRALLFDYQDAEEEVRNHFLLALELDPDLQLDPLFFSPKLQDMLQKLKDDRRDGNSVAADIGRPTIRYLPMPDPRVEAALRSLVLPGWGQWKKGQKTRARLFFVSTVGLATATAAAHLLRRRAEQRYLSARRLDEISSRYEAFNRYHKLRNNLAAATAFVWLLNFADALIVRPPQQPSPLGLLHPQFRLSPTGVAVGFRFRLQPRLSAE